MKIFSRYLVVAGLIASFIFVAANSWAQPGDGQNRRWRPNGAQGGPPPGGPQGNSQGGPQGGPPRRFEMTKERYEQLKADPERLERMKERGIITQERIDQWEAGDFSSGASPETAAADAAKAEEKAKAAAEGKEVPEELEPLTEEEQAAADKILRQGTVPDFSGGEKRTEDSENEYFYNAMAKRDFSLLPSPPVKMRRYARYLMNKFDANQDGRLQESEWAKLAGAQAIDTDGDFELREDEIIYYLAKFADGKTIFNPNPFRPTQRNVVVSEQPLKIQPLSAPVKLQTPQEAEKTAEVDGFGDMSEEQMNALMEESSEELEKIDDPDLLEVLLQEIDDSNVREFAVPAQLLKGTPVWFIARDRNGDGQLSLREFAPTLSNNGVSFFGRLDSNGDGLLTPDEVRAYLNNSKQ